MNRYYDKFLMRVTDSSKPSGYRWSFWMTTGTGEWSAKELRLMANEIDKRNGIEVLPDSKLGWLQ